VFAYRSHEGWFQSRPYRIEHQFQALEDQSVLEPNHSHIQLSQKFISLRILFATDQSHMFCSVDFDGDAKLRTIKVDNVRTYTVLPSEFLSIELGFLKILPEKGFCVRGIPAKIRTFFSALSVVVNEIASLHVATHTRQVPFMEPPPAGSASRSRCPPDSGGPFLSLRLQPNPSPRYFAAASRAFKSASPG
jgi:hypothetical protein